MNILLWILQVLLAGLYIIGGVTKIFMFEKFAQQVASTNALPEALWAAIGVFEVLCGLGLTLPAATKRLPSLTPIAASCLAVEGLVFTVFHAAYGEHSAMAFGFVSAALAAFVAYGRFALDPLQVKRSAR